MTWQNASAAPGRDLTRADLPYVDLAAEGGDPTGSQSVSSRLNDMIAEMLAGTRPTLPIRLAGRFLSTAPIVIDRTGVTVDPTTGLGKQIRLFGDGAQSSQIYSSHAGACIDYRGGSDVSVHSMLRMSGLGLYGNNRLAGSIGLKLDNIAYFNISDLDVSLFEYGIDATDMLSGCIDSCHLRLNNKGFRFQYANLSRPNAIVLKNLVVTGNRTYGGHIVGGSNITFLGGSVEGNGIGLTLADTAGWGIKAEEMCVEGGVGLAIYGTYFEANNGRADLDLVQAAGLSRHMVSGATFNRLSSTAYTTYNILLSAGTNSVVTVAGCGFRTFGTYVENSGRPHCAGPTFGFANGGGNYFASFTRAEVWAPTRHNNTPTAFLGTAASRAGQLVSVTDGDSGSPCLAMSDGTNWRRIVLGATISAT